MLIESTHNGAVKRARSLASKKGRAESGLHFIEGEKLVREAVASGAGIAEAFVEEGHEDAEEVLSQCGARVYRVKRRVLESIALTDTPQWVCALARTPGTLPPEEYPKGLITALDMVQDPGNLGTILRTADAVGASGVLLGRGCADPYGPKAMRAAMGSVYHLQVWQGELVPELGRLKASGFVLVCGHLKGGSALPPPGEKCALIIGSEGRGVSDEAAALCIKYRLPMFGRAESLNASVAAGILMYELAGAMRQ